MKRVKRGEAEQTIVDITDNRKLTVMISTNKARQIIYNPNDDTYNPDFSEEPMVLTPELYITGSPTNVIATAEAVKWYVRPNTLGQRIPIENNDTYSIGNDFKLTINKNIMKDMLTMEFILEVIYKEPDSDFKTVIPHHMELVTISIGENGRDGERGLQGPKGEDGADSATLVIITPDGTTVRDGTGRIRLESKLFVGGKEATASSYRWYYSNGSSTVTHATTKNTSIEASIIKNSLPIFLDATYNGTTYTSSVTINDISDVYTSIILGVSTFKNGKGSNTYTVKLYRNGEEIDQGGSQYSYEWEKLNSQGIKDTKFTKTGKTITITANDIDNTNLFNCYIYTK